MTLTREEFEQAYRERFLEKDRKFSYYDYWKGKDVNMSEVNPKRTLWFYDLIMPSFDPQDKRIKICTTKKTGLPRMIGNADLLRRLFELNQGIMTDKLEEADAAVYWGEYLCDSNFGGVSVIEYISFHVEKRDMTALLFYMGEQTQRHCIPNCGVAQDILELGRKGKKILHFPLGYPYRADNAPIVDVIG